MSNSLFATFNRRDMLLLRASSDFKVDTCDTTGGAICELDSMTNDSEGPTMVSFDRRLVCPGKELRLLLVEVVDLREMGSIKRSETMLVAVGGEARGCAFSSASNGANYESTLALVEISSNHQSTHWLTY
jgi:hypothetical protein